MLGGCVMEGERLVFFFLCQCSDGHEWVLVAWRRRDGRVTWPVAACMAHVSGSCLVNDVHSEARSSSFARPGMQLTADLEVRIDRMAAEGGLARR